MRNLNLLHYRQIRLLRHLGHSLAHFLILVPQLGKWPPLLVPFFHFDQAVLQENMEIWLTAELVRKIGEYLEERNGFIGQGIFKGMMFKRIKSIVIKFE